MSRNHGAANRVCSPQHVLWKARLGCRGSIALPPFAAAAAAPPPPAARGVPIGNGSASGGEEERVEVSLGEERGGGRARVEVRALVRHSQEEEEGEGERESEREGRESGDVWCGGGLFGLPFFLAWGTLANYLWAMGI